MNDLIPPAADSTLTAVLAPPGWYVDPGDQNRERWWTGAEWSSVTAGLARSMYGPGYVRSMRAGVNRSALIGSILSRVALLVWLLLFVVSSFGWGATLFAGGSFLGIVPILLIMAIVGVVFSIRGARASKRLGGLGLSIFGIGTGVVAILASLFLLIVLLPAP